MKDYRTSKEKQIIRRIVKPIVENMIAQKENNMPKVMRTKVIEGEFVKLGDIRQYQYSIPYEVRKKLIEQIGKELHIQMFTDEIKRLEKDIIYLKYQLWNAKVPLIVKLFSLGFYCLLNPWRDSLKFYDSADM